MNQLASVGLILLISLLAGRLVKFAHVPEVTGYIVSGLILGPSMMGWIREDNVAALQVLSDVALGLIMFSIGSIFKFDRFRRIKKDVFRLTVVDTLLVAVMVGGAMMLCGQGWKPSILLGIIAIETAAASTLMVIREYDASGPLTETITGFIAVNNVTCLVLFSIAVCGLQLAQAASGPFHWQALIRPAYMLVWQLIGSVALGYIIGVLLATWATRVMEHGETLILLIGCIILSIGLATMMELSSLISSLVVGATAANFSKHSRRLADVQSRTDPPFYAIFFVIAGANLHVSMLKTLGLVGVAYIVARGAAKFLSVRTAAPRTSLPPEAQQGMRVALLSHAGLAIGLTLSLKTLLPNMADKVSTVVLAAILAYEIIGPFGTRYALLKSDEARKEPGDETSDVMA